MVCSSTLQPKMNASCERQSVWADIVNVAVNPQPNSTVVLIKNCTNSALPTMQLDL